MNDRFKFKCWDKKINQMRYGDIQLAFNGRPFVLEDSSKGLTVADIDDIKILQCTGIADKNGKLIYEGDILLSLIDKSHVGVVYWDKEKACFRIRGNGIAYNALQTLHSENAFEIIGNIYMDSHLLDISNNL